MKGLSKAVGMLQKAVGASGCLQSSCSMPWDHTHPAIVWQHLQQRLSSACFLKTVHAPARPLHAARTLVLLQLVHENLPRKTLLTRRSKCSNGSDLQSTCPYLHHVFAFACDIRQAYVTTKPEKDAASTTFSLTCALLHSPSEAASRQVYNVGGSNLIVLKS